MQNAPIIYGYARVATDVQSVEAQVRQLTKPDAPRCSGTASGARPDRLQLRRALKRCAGHRSEVPLLPLFSVPLHLVIDS
jgi:hypothetical protein